jgi:outer membrane protein assembly factor BamB
MHRILPLLAMSILVLATAEEGLITSWRGHTYQGVMPARDLVRTFAWVDEDATMPAPSDFGRDTLGKGQTQLSCKPGDRINACWRVTLPAWGHCAPVAVGSKVFVTCEATTMSEGRFQLVCVDIPTGTVDWIKPIDHLLAWKDPAAVAKIQAIRMAEVKGWAEAYAWMNRVFFDERGVQVPGFKYGADKPPTVIPPERQAVYDQAVAAGYPGMCIPYHGEAGIFGSKERKRQFVEAARSRAFVSSWNKDFPWYGNTWASPVGDGTAVYAVAAPDAVVCYELDGRLRWAADMEVGAAKDGPCRDHHRHLASPVIVAGKLLYWNVTSSTVFAYDCATGAKVWAATLPHVKVEKHPKDQERSAPDDQHEDKERPRGCGGHMGPGGTPVPMTLTDTVNGQQVPVLVVASGHVVRIEDGRVLDWINPFQAIQHPDYAPSYGTAVAVGDIYVSIHSLALRLSLSNGELKTERLWERKGTLHKSAGVVEKTGHETDLSCVAWKDVIIPFRSGRGWDLTSGNNAGDGRQLTQRSGHQYQSGFMSLDGTLVYRGSNLPPKERFGHRGFVIGIDAYDGSYSDYGVIIEGTLPDAVKAANMDRFGKPGMFAGWSQPTAFGNRIFVRTTAYLYCFGQGDWIPARP